MKKKLFALFTAIVLCVTSLGVMSASAATVASGNCSSTVSWALDSEGTLTVSGTGAMPDYEANTTPWYSNRDNIKKVVIADGITSIGSWAFYSSSNLEAISFGSNVTKIGLRAFATCKKITNVIIPNSVISIGEYAFANDEGITKLTLGNKLETIGDNAFYNCKGLTAITIPDSVITLGNSAFISCSSLTSAVIGGGVATIGESAFHSCSKLSDLTIGSGVTEIGKSSFHNCTALKNITFMGTQLQWNKMTVGTQNDALSQAAVQVMPDTTCGAAATWNVDEDGTLTISGEGLMANYTSASMPWIDYRNDITKIVIEDGITSVGTWAFYSMPNLTEVVLPDSLVRIGLRAFATCKGLTEITIPDSVTFIGERAFANDEQLARVDLGYGVETIDAYAFYNCTSLAKISIPNSVTTLGTFAFNTCSALKEAIIGSGLSTISESAFRNCSSLAKITIGSNVTTIGASAFRTCSSLQDVYYRGNAQKWANVSIGAYNTNLTDATFHYTDVGDYLTWNLDGNGILTVSGIGEMYDFEARTMPWYSQRNNVKKVVLADGVTNVGTWAFYNHPNLEEISFGDSVANIGLRAFASCKKLASINLEGNITTVGDYAFASCETAKEIVFGEHITTVGNDAFYNCKGLTELTLPARISSWGSRVFTSCSNLTKVILEDGIDTIGVSMFHGCSKLETITIPETVTAILDSAFRDCSALTDVYYSGSEEQWNAIMVGIQNTALENATIHFASEEGICGEAVIWYLDTNGILTISGTGDMYDYSEDAQPWAEYAEDIISVVITEGVTSIGDGAFSALENLEAITIPASVTAIGEAVFFGCNKLASITVAEENSSYCAVDNVLLNQDQTVLIQYASAKEDTEYVIPEGVTTIAKGAFAATVLERLTVPHSVTTIKENAFAFCTALTNIFYDGFQSDWEQMISEYAGNEALSNAAAQFSCYEGTCGENVIWQLDTNGTLTISGTGAMADYELRKTPWYSLRSSITAVVIEDGVTAIGVGAFYECGNITEVTFSDDLVTIGDRAFGNCKRITEITLPDGLTAIGEFAFANCEGLTNLIFNETVETIGASAFYNCIGLTNLVIPNSVTALGEKAFQNCTALTDVVIGNGITAIAPYTFHNGFNLVNVTIPETVTSIGASAFDLCTKLKTIYYYGTEADWAAMEIGEKNEGILNASMYYFSGICGDNMTWSVTSDGVLTLGGTGDMYDYTAYTMPWYDHIENIREVIIGDGVTGIGNSAFQGALNLTDITWSTSLQTIGERAFSGCASLDAVVLPETVTEISDHAFAYCSSMSAITFSKNVATIGQYAFYQDSNLKDVYYYGEPENWEAIAVGNYNDYFNSVTVHYVTVIKTDVSEDGKAFTVNLLNVEEGQTVILALYQGNKLVEVQDEPYEGASVPFTTTEEYSNAKVMVWDSISALTTKYQVEIVK